MTQSGSTGFNPVLAVAILTALILTLATYRRTRSIRTTALVVVGVFIGWILIGQIAHIWFE